MNSKVYILTRNSDKGLVHLTFEREESLKGKLPKDFLKSFMKSDSDSVIQVNEDNLNPDVSVIISTFNAGSFLREAIDSVIYQESDLKIEIIIMFDKGSKVETIEVISDYINKNPFTSFKVAILSHMSDFREKTLSPLLAKGKYVFFLDYDDKFEKSKIQKQVDGLKRSGKSFSFSSQVDIDAEGNVISNRSAEHRSLSLAQLVRENVASMSSICFTKEFFTNTISRILSKLNDPYFDWILPDYFFTLLAANSKEIKFERQAVMYYRIHSSNVFHVDANDHSDDAFVSRAKKAEKVLKTLVALTLSTGMGKDETNFGLTSLILINPAYRNLIHGRLAVKSLKNKNIRRIEFLARKAFYDHRS